MAKIRQISVLAYDLFEKNRKALSLTENEYLLGLMGLETNIKNQKKEIDEE